NSHPPCPEPLLQSVVGQHAANKRVPAEHRLAGVRLLRTWAQAFRLLSLSSRRQSGYSFYSSQTPRASRNPQSASNSKPIDSLGEHMGVSPHRLRWVVSGVALAPL